MKYVSINEHLIILHNYLDVLPWVCKETVETRFSFQNPRGENSAVWIITYGSRAAG